MSAAAVAPDNMLSKLERLAAVAQATLPKTRHAGIVTEVTPAVCRISGLSQFVRLGECVTMQTGDHAELAEVIHIDETGVIVKPVDVAIRAGLGTLAWRQNAVGFNPDRSWKGRVINALGVPVDGAGTLAKGERGFSADREPPAPLRRKRVSEALRTGVRIVDMFTPLCHGQRVGIFAGSGIGKSTLLAMLARSRGFDCVVIALVGERGREVREFIEDTLGAERARAVVVVSTGDESPMMRRLAPRTAMCVAEYFRDRGENVLLIIDSVTRFAHAARDVALAAGEPPVARGFPPSVFSDLPKLLERAGPGEDGTGAITGIFSVLVDGDDHNDPVADSIRGTLDGHIVLDRAIADQGRYPAVNLLTSVSRLAEVAWTAEQRKLVLKLRAMIARFEDTRDLRLMGGYRSGSDAELDKSVELTPKIYDALKQDPDEPPSPDAFQAVAKALAG